MAANDPIHITITILNSCIDMWVKPEHEAFYREAESRIKERADDLRNKWGINDPQDLLLKLLIETTVNYIAQNSQLHAYQNMVIPKMEQLLALSDHIKTTIAEETPQCTQ